MMTFDHSHRLRAIERRQAMSRIAVARRSRAFHALSYANLRESVWYRRLQMLALLLIATGIVVGIVLLTENRAIIDEIEEEIKTAQPDGSSNNPNDPAVVTENGIIVPNINRPSRAEVLAYTTEAWKPKRIEIEKADVFSRVKTVEENGLGEISAPENIYDAAWYSKSSLVGESPGSSIITGHIGFRSIEGTFYKLEDIRSGDTIKIVMGDDREFTYLVTDYEKVKLSDFSMSKYLSYRGKEKSQLHLITCVGDILRGSTTYDSRYVVTAEIID